MMVMVDIDGTICKTNGMSYDAAEPLFDKIEKINNLYNKGNTIVYWTSRGVVTGIDWRELTTKQLKEWGCKYHELRLDKPYYDIFIDDKSVNPEQLLKTWKNIPIGK